MRNDKLFDAALPAMRRLKLISYLFVLVLEVQAHSRFQIVVIRYRSKYYNATSREYYI